MLALVCAAAILPSPSVDQLRTWGLETLEMIRRDYYMPEEKMYGEEFVPGERPKQVCFNWSSGVLLSALAAGARHDDKVKPWLREYADSMDRYWNPAPPVAGFDVLPVPKPIDRYYDDNAWMVMALVETYEVLKDAKYLDRAEAALKYVLSGEDEKLGGGIYWRESDRASKNTCSNAPSAAACIAVYRHRKDPKYLAKARSIYDWTRKNLRDPEDGLYWDNMDLAGKIEKTKWTYNSGLMLRTAIDLDKIKQDKDLENDAGELMRSSIEQWLDFEGNWGIKDEAKFSHLLFENWAYHLSHNKPADLSKAFPIFQRPLANLHDKLRSADGHYGSRWDKAPTQPKYALIDQASAARAYYMAYETLKN
jgi:hypothetical protein